MGLFGGTNKDDSEQQKPQLQSQPEKTAIAGAIRVQVDEAMAGAAFLDPAAPDYGQIHYTSDRDVAVKAAIAGLITAVRILADRLDAK